MTEYYDKDAVPPVGTRCIATIQGKERGLATIISVGEFAAEHTSEPPDQHTAVRMADDSDGWPGLILQVSTDTLRPLSAEEQKKWPAEPEPVAEPAGPLFYAAWKEGEHTGGVSGLGKATTGEPVVYCIDGDVFRFSYGGEWHIWLEPQTRIAYFREHYTPCTEAEALASVSADPAEAKVLYFKTNDGSAVVRVPISTLDPVEIRRPGEKDWRESSFDRDYWTKGHAEISLADANRILGLDVEPAPAEDLCTCDTGACVDRGPLCEYCREEWPDGAVECETCQGHGECMQGSGDGGVHHEIDAECPDCDGKGYYEPAPAEKPAEAKRRWFKGESEACAAMVVFPDGAVDEYQRVQKGKSSWDGDNHWARADRFAETALYDELPEPDALAYLEEKGWPLPPGMEPEPASVVADVTGPDYNPADVAFDAKPVAEKKFKEEQYIVGDCDRIYRVVTADEYFEHCPKFDPSEIAMFALEADKSGGLGVRQDGLASFSLWQPEVGEKVWDKDSGKVVTVTGFAPPHILLDSLAGRHLEDVGPASFAPDQAEPPAKPIARKHCKMDETPEPERKPTMRYWIDGGKKRYWQELPDGTVQCVRLGAQNPSVNSIATMEKWARSEHDSVREVSRAVALAWVGQEEEAPITGTGAARDTHTPTPPTGKDTIMETTTDNVPVIAFATHPKCPCCGKKGTPGRGFWDDRVNHRYAWNKERGLHVGQCNCCKADFSMWPKHGQQPTVGNPPESMTATESEAHSRAAKATLPLHYRLLDGALRLAWRAVKKPVCWVNRQVKFFAKCAAGSYIILVTGLNAWEHELEAEATIAGIWDTTATLAQTAFDAGWTAIVG